MRKIFKTEKQIRIASIIHWVLTFLLSAALFVVSGKLFPGHEQWIAFCVGILNLLVNKIARELPNGEEPSSNKESESKDESEKDD